MVMTCLVRPLTSHNLPQARSLGGTGAKEIEKRDGDEHPPSLAVRGLAQSEGRHYVPFCPSKDFNI
jgi:hypothetical protein